MDKANCWMLNQMAVGEAHTIRTHKYVYTCVLYIYTFIHTHTHTHTHTHIYIYIYYKRTCWMPNKAIVGFVGIRGSRYAEFGF